MTLFRLSSRQNTFIRGHNPGNKVSLSVGF